LTANTYYFPASYGRLVLTFSYNKGTAFLVLERYFILVLTISHFTTHGYINPNPIPDDGGRDSPRNVETNFMFTREDLIAFSRRKTFQSYNDRLTINNSPPNSSSGDTPAVHKGQTV
jgi:hypothetical protein